MYCASLFDMKKQTLIKLAGSQGAAAKIFGITSSAIGQWPDDVPYPRFLELKDKRPEWFKGGEVRPELISATSPTDV